MSAATKVASQAEKKIEEVIVGKSVSGAVAKTNPFNKGPSIGERAFGGLTSKVGTIQMFAGIAGVVAAGLNWVGTHVPFGKGLFTKPASLLVKPNELLDGTKLSDIGNGSIKAAGYVGTKLKSVNYDGFGIKLNTEELGTHIRAGTRNIKRNAFKSAENVFENIGTKIEANSVVQKYVGHVAKQSDKAAAKVADQFVKNADKLTGAASKLAEHGVADFGGISETLTNAINSSDKAGIIDTAARLANRAKEAEFGPSLNADARKAAAEASKALHKNLGKAMGQADAAVVKLDKWKNIPPSLRKIPSNIANMSAGQALQATAMLAGSAAATFSFAKHQGMKRRVLANMKEELGANSSEYLQARKSARMEFIPQAAAQVASWATTLMQMMGKGSGKLFIANMGISMLSGMLPSITGGNSLQAWAHLSDAVITKKATAADYALFLTSGPILTTNGVDPSLSDLQKLAQFYLEQGATPAQLVKLERAGQVNEAALAIQRGETPQALAQAVPSAVQGIGEHTNRLLESRGMSTRNKALVIGGGALVAGAAVAAATQPQFREKMGKLFSENYAKFGKHTEAVAAGAAKVTTQGAGIGV